MIVERFLGGEDAQPFAGAAHRAGQEQAVDPLGVLERLAQPATGLEVETEREITELEIEIEEGDALLVLLAETPADARRQRRGADPAARTDQRDDTRLLGRRGVCGTLDRPACLEESLIERLGRDRLVKRVDGPRCG